MSKGFDFFKTSMPSTRIADYYLGCMDGCVFLDFSLTEHSSIFLRRISFDGYGCCNIDGHIISMTQEDSLQFINIYNEDHLNQEVMTRLITNTIEINREHIWQDALKEYGFIK